MTEQVPTLTTPVGQVLLQKLYLLYIGLLPIAATVGAIVLFERALPIYVSYRW